MKTQFIKFIFVGIVAAIVDLSTLRLLEMTTPLNKYLIVTLSYTLSLICNFLLSKYFTYRANGNPIKQFAFFVIISLANLLATLCLIYLLSKLFDIPLLYLRILSLVITTPVVFVCNKLLTFKNERMYDN
jgi:putative flippase GtrA